MKIRVYKGQAFEDEFGDRHEVRQITSNGVALEGPDGMVHMGLDDLADELENGSLSIVTDDEEE